MTITSQLPMRSAAAITGDGMRCVLCERLWPREPMPLWHTMVISATEPVATCSCPDGTEEEPHWHAFEILNHRRCLVAAGLVCPQCITTKGFEAAVLAACFKAMCAHENTN